MNSKGTLTLDDSFLPHSSFLCAKHLLQLTYVVGFLSVLEKYYDTGSPLEKFNLVNKGPQATRQHLGLRCPECFGHRGRDTYLRIPGKSRRRQKGKDGVGLLRLVVQEFYFLLI